MLTPCLVIAFIIAFMGSLVTEETAPSLLTGYNTMSDDKKKNINFKGIAKVYRTIFYSIAFILIVIGALSYFFENENLWAALLTLTCTWGFIPLFFLSKKYDPNSYPKWKYVINYLVLAFLFLLGLFLAFGAFTHEGTFLIE